MTHDLLIKSVLENEPDIGSGDISKCLPGWIQSFAIWVIKGEPVTLSPSAVKALFHTLLAARERVARIVSERDRNKNDNGGGNNYHKE